MWLNDMYVCVCVYVCTAASGSSVDEKGKYNVTLYFMLTCYQYILIAAVDKGGLDEHKL